MDVAGEQHTIRDTTVALRESEARYRRMRDIDGVGMFVSDERSGTLLDASDGFLRMTGYTRAAVDAGELSWRLLTPAEHMAASEAELEHLARTGRVGPYEKECFLADGSRSWMLFVGASLGDGTVVEYCIDVGDRRKAAHALERDTMRRLLFLAEEEERRRIARELHDEVGQHLTAVALGLQALSDVASPGSETDRRAAELRATVSTMGRELHALAVRLRPKVLDDFGLAAALEAHVVEWSRRSGIAVDLHLPGAVERLPDAVESALYRIVQEALTNVAKHSGATRASVLVERRDGHVIAVVEDDGRGFDERARARDPGRRAGLGLLGIRERAELLGGTLDIESTGITGRGTSLFVRIPMSDGAAARPDDHVAAERSDA